MKEIRIYVPEKVWNLLEKIEKEHKVRKEDIILKAIIRVLEGYLGESIYGA